MPYDEKTNYENEEKYLNGLVNAGGGNAEWAKNQLNVLAEAKNKYGNAGTSTAPAASSSGSPSSSTSPSTSSSTSSSKSSSTSSSTSPSTSPSDSYAKAVAGAQEGSGGYGAYNGVGFTGNTTAVTPDGRTITVSYVDGVLQNKESIPDGTVVQAKNGQNYVYRSGASAPQKTTVPTGSSVGSAAPDFVTPLQQWLSAAQEQAKLQSEYAVSQGVNELTRAEQDAQEQFETERRQIAEAEAKALDNQALYNERRGDRGGIGAAQYDSIMNTAAQNQLAVNKAQTKLSTDTARQIADLRAQGAFEEADAVLQLTQTYLSQLISLQQWAAQYNLSVEQFNKQLEQWNYEFEAEVAQLTGSYRGMPTQAARQLETNMTGYYNGEPTLALQQSLAQAGETLASRGIMPSDSQIAAMQTISGYTPGQVQTIVTAAQIAQKTGVSSGGGGGGGTKNEKAPDVKANPLGWLKYNDVRTRNDAYQLLLANGYEAAGEDGASAAYWANRYQEYLNGQNSNPSSLSYDEDEGTFYWSGKTYGSVNALRNAVDDAYDKGNIDYQTVLDITLALNRYGFSFN